MLGALLGCPFILLALAASAIARQFDLGPENAVADNPQISLGNHDDYRPVCHGISRGISPASQVFYSGSPQFLEDMAHWISSSSQISTCSVRPGTLEDLSSILRELSFTRVSGSRTLDDYTAKRLKCDLLKRAVFSRIQTWDLLY